LSQDESRKVFRGFDVLSGAPCLAGTSPRIRSLYPKIVTIRKMKRTYEEEEEGREMLRCIVRLKPTPEQNPARRRGFSRNSKSAQGMSWPVECCILVRKQPGPASCTFPLGLCLACIRSTRPESRLFHWRLLLAHG